MMQLLFLYILQEQTTELRGQYLSTH
jgi:hypothetical protein